MVRPAIAVAAWTGLSRVLGLARDLLQAHLFGATMLMDAFAVALLVPNLSRRLFGEGAATSAFVPAFVAEREKRGLESAGMLFRAAFTWLLLILLGLTVVGEVATLFVRGSGRPALILDLLRITLPYMPLICLTALCGAALNSMRHFAAPAAAPVVLNLTWIAALLAGLVWLRDEPSRAMTLVAWAIVAGGVLQLAMQAPPLARRGLVPWPTSRLNHEGVREAGRLFAPAVLGVALFQLNEFMDSVIATTMIQGDGAVSALYYANRLHLLPHSLIGVALGTVVLPALAKAAATGVGYRDMLVRALRVGMFFAIPAGVGLMVLSEPLIRLVYEHGEFGADDTARTAKVLFFYASGLAFYVAAGLLTRALHAQKEMKAPFRLMILCVALNLTLNLLLVGPMREAGLALATSIAGAVQVAGLLILLAWRGTGIAREFAQTLVRCGAAAAVMAAAVIYVPVESAIARAGVGALVYFAAAAVLAPAETRAVRR